MRAAGRSGNTFEVILLEESGNAFDVILWDESGNTCNSTSLPSLDHPCFAHNLVEDFLLC